MGCLIRYDPDSFFLQFKDRFYIGDIFFTSNKNFTMQIY